MLELIVAPNLGMFKHSLALHHVNTLINGTLEDSEPLQSFQKRTAAIYPYLTQNNSLLTILGKTPFGLPDSKKFKKSRVDANQRHVIMYLTHLQVPT
jgi:hypothetical protein